MFDWSNFNSVHSSAILNHSASSHSASSYSPTHSTYGDGGGYSADSGQHHLGAPYSSHHHNYHPSNHTNYHSTYHGRASYGGLTHSTTTSLAKNLLTNGHQEAGAKGVSQTGVGRVGHWQGHSPQKLTFHSDSIGINSYGAIYWDGRYKGDLDGIYIKNSNHQIVAKYVCHHVWLWSGDHYVDVGYAENAHEAVSRVCLQYRAMGNW